MGNCGAYIIKEGESGHCCLHSSPSIKSAVIKDGHVSLDFVFFKNNFNLFIYNHIKIINLLFYNNNYYYTVTAL